MPGRTVAGSDLALGFGTFLACLLTPAVFYAVGVKKVFGEVAISAYVPYEQMRIALRNPDLPGLLSMSLVELNFSSSNSVSSMYTLSLGQLLFAIVLPLLVVALRSAKRRECVLPRSGVNGLAFLGPVTALGGVTTSLAGCCGAGFAGAAFSLFGVGSMTAASFSQNFVYMQIGVVSLLSLLVIHQWFVRPRLQRSRRTRISYGTQTDRA
ncbi:MAG: hypothetical protein HWE23_03015 [Rhodobacteraceae bacterium]|nr:hypothetical protein [Paracoccaceae bacterium]